MIKREKKLVITFETTEDAMMMETVCRKGNVPGRLIPVPGFISAGCGLAWCAEIQREASLREMMREHGILPQQIQICLI